MFYNNRINTPFVLQIRLNKLINKTMKLQAKHLPNIAVGIIVIIIFTIATCSSCSVQQTLTQPEFYQATITKIDTINTITINEYRLKKRKQLQITMTNTQGFEWLRYESIDSVRFIGELSY